MNLPSIRTPNPPVLRGSGLFTLPFVLAVFLLFTAACLAGPVASWLHISAGKKALPLRAPLAELNTGALQPYRVVQREVFPPSIVEALHTDTYVSWVLEDPTVPVNSPVRYVRLLITYDSGGSNLVPHTPEVCWFGGGYERAQPHENRTIAVEGLEPGRSTVPIRVCTFQKTSLQNRAKQSVIYTFECNGRFLATRTGVRVLLNKPTNTYAYFSKVELSFPQATREESVAAAIKLLRRLLPILVRNHWPDFEAAEMAAG